MKFAALRTEVRSLWDELGNEHAEQRRIGVALVREARGLRAMRVDAFTARRLAALADRLEAHALDLAVDAREVP